MSYQVKRVTVTKDGQRAQVKESHVSAYEEHGWTRADDGDSESVQPAPQQAAPTSEGAS